METSSSTIRSPASIDLVDHPDHMPPIQQQEQQHSVAAATSTTDVEPVGDDVMKNTWLNTSNSSLSTPPLAIMDNASSDPTIGKTKASIAPDSMSRPLQLLDLPVDILKDIIKEVRSSLHGRGIYYGWSCAQRAHGLAS